MPDTAKAYGMNYLYNSEEKKETQTQKERERETRIFPQNVSSVIGHRCVFYSFGPFEAGLFHSINEVKDR